MFSAPIQSESVGWSRWFFSSLSFECSNVANLEFDNNSSWMKVTNLQGKQVKGYFCMPCLVNTWTIHLVLATRMGIVIKGWVSREAVSDENFRRMSRWVHRQRRKA